MKFIIIPSLIRSLFYGQLPAPKKSRIPFGVSLDVRDFLSLFYLLGICLISQVLLNKLFMRLGINLMIFCLMGTPLQASYCYEYNRNEDLRGHNIAMRLKDPTGENIGYLYTSNFFGVDGYFLENGLLYKRQLARYRKPDDSYPAWDPSQMNSASFQDGHIYVHGKRQVKGHVYWALGGDKELRIATNDAYHCQVDQLFQDANHVALPTLCAGGMYFNGRISEIDNITNSYKHNCVSLLYAVHHLAQFDVFTANCRVVLDSTRTVPIETALAVAEKYEFYYK